MDHPEKWDVPPELKRKMHALSRDLRQRATLAETILWQAIRNRKLDGRKFRAKFQLALL